MDDNPRVEPRAQRRAAIRVRARGSPDPGLAAEHRAILEERRRRFAGNFEAEWAERMRRWEAEGR